MFRLAVLSGRGRLGTFTGALVALIAASVLSTAWGMQLESVLRGHPAVERYAGASAVVTGRQIVGPDNDVPLTERARVSSALTARLAAVPGVRAAIGDVNDAGRWLVAQGIADPAKLAAVGWSYGGYAALQANVLDPKLYKAVVAVAPVVPFVPVPPLSAPGATVAPVTPVAPLAGCTASRSTMKISVELAGIVGGWPWAP